MYDYGTDWINPDVGNKGFTGGLQFASGLANLTGLSRGTNPAKSANMYLDKIPGVLDPLKQRYSSLDTNPGDEYNKMASGYQKSPGYDFALKEALGAANNATAAGGMVGTPLSQETNANIAGGLASRDFENYLNHIMDLHGQGLVGSQQIAQMLSELLETQGQYAYAGQAGENQAQSGGINDLISGAISLAPALGFI